MSDIKIFRLSGETVTELEGRSAEIEKSLQTLIERHLETSLGVRFLATEYSTGKTHGGLEITIKSPADFERAKPYILTSYEAS